MCLQAIETGFGYGQWLHGEAVAAGTVSHLLQVSFCHSFTVYHSPRVDLVFVMMLRSWLLTCHIALVGLMILL